MAGWSAHGIDPISRQYVDGIWELHNLLQSVNGPW
jgi:hypothetical protein